MLNLYNLELTELNISACQFNQVGAMFIYNCLKKNIPLKALYIDENKLRGPTMRYFTEAIWKNNKLRKLSMAS